MANEPIDEPSYLFGVNVVDIGDLRVSRGLTRRPASSCRHARISYDPRERRIWCRDCEQDVDPFDSFVLLVEQYDRAASDLKRKQDELKQAVNFRIISVAAKTIDKAWRRRNMVPACPACGNGLFPEDFKHTPSMLGREYAEARRGKIREDKKR